MGLLRCRCLYLIARINGSEEILAGQRGGVWSRVFVWMTFGVMALSAVALLYTVVFQHSSK